MNAQGTGQSDQVTKRLHIKRTNSTKLCITCTCRFSAYVYNQNTAVDVGWSSSGFAVGYGGKYTVKVCIIIVDM